MKNQIQNFSIQIIWIGLFHTRCYVKFRHVYLQQVLNLFLITNKILKIDLQAL
jgi:hypothetical protein